VHELPFAPPGVVRRLEGREAVRAHFAQMSDRPRRETGFRPVCIHETKDPEVIVVELDAEGVVTATGQPYVLRYVEVIRVRDGQIVLWRDYWNPLATGELEGAVS
jgi:ketosteroid isomerase-like protein